MAISKKQLISDCELQLLQSAPSDDSELSREQIAFWISYELNRLVAAEINSKTAKGESIPSIYIKRSELEVAELETEDDVDEEDERVFVTLDEEPLTLNKQREIVLITTDEGDEVRQMDINTHQIFKHMRFSKPSLENLLYYRQSPLTIFIEGFKAVDLPFNKLFVFYVPKQDLLTMADDDDVLVSDLILPEVINAVVQRGMLELYGTQPDVSNDGSDVKQSAYHTSISNRQQ